MKQIKNIIMNEKTKKAKKELSSKVKFHKQDEEGIQMASKIVEEYGDIRAAEALKLGLQQGEEKKANQKEIIKRVKALLKDKRAKTPFAKTAFMKVFCVYPGAYVSLFNLRNKVKKH